MPGLASASRAFAIAPDNAIPGDNLDVAEILGAYALAAARRIADIVPESPKPMLTLRQREYVLWSARGKTAAILGVTGDTVVQHLKITRVPMALPRPIRW